jgi:methyl-accepting chemotaxis protein
MIPSMTADPPKPQLLRLLRHAAKEDRGLGERAAAEETALWSAHERALVRARDAAAAAQRIGASAARQRGAMETVAEHTRALAARVTELQAGGARMLDAFERLGLVALNAGLEGARLGESEGRQLGLVGDEVRSHATRGADAGRELTMHFAQWSAELAQLDGHVGQAHAVVTEVTQEAARAAGAASDAEAALLDVAERVKRATGSDPEAVRAVAEASERARAFATSLAALRGKVPRELLLIALRPAVEPLERLLLDDEAGAGPEED